MPSKNPRLLPLTTILLAAFLLALLPACDVQNDRQTDQASAPTVSLKRMGYLDASQINEASGMQASFSNNGAYFVHNDEGRSLLYVIDENGNDLGDVSIDPARNKDWEDITSVPVGDSRWLVAGDIGDNWSKRKYITLYFAREPRADKDGRYSGMQLLEHRLDLSYPDGPRDAESMAYDPLGKQILILSKRDKPAHLYAVDLETALSEDQAELKFLGTIAALRPPTIADRAMWGGRVDWISQPTGMDISVDGSEAAVITYRSLYRFDRQAGEDWLTAMQRKPEEVVGPPAPQNEAIAYSIDGKSIFVTTEKLPAPLYRFRFRDPEVAKQSVDKN